MNNSGNIFSNDKTAEDNPLGECEGIYMDYEKKEVILTITNPENGKLMNINPKIFVTSEEELAYIRLMESTGFYYMGITDEEGHIPENLFNLFKCDKSNTILYHKYPPYKKCMMIFIQIPGMGEKEDNFDDVRNGVIKELFGTQEEVKSRVRVLCNSGITYGNPITRKPVQKYRTLKNYY